MSSKKKYHSEITWSDVRDNLTHMEELTGWAWRVRVEQSVRGGPNLYITVDAVAHTMEAVPEPSYVRREPWNPALKPDLAPIVARLLTECWSDLHGSPWNWSPRMRKNARQEQG